MSAPPPSTSAETGGGARASHELVRELAVVLAVVTLLTVILAVLFSSPDERPSTIRQWSRQDPVGFLKTAVSELGGSSETAEYGPPYNHASDGQHAAFLAPQKWLGVTHPIDTANDFVFGPLRTIPDAELQAEISYYERLPTSSKEDALNNSEKVLLGGSPLASDGRVGIWPGEYEYIDNMMRALLPFAQSGDLEDYLLAGHGYYQADFTKPLLLMTDGGVLEQRANAEHLPDGQWAMMNETGNYPGLPWLWPYVFWYQFKPFKSSPNADLLVWLVMAVLALAFVCVPLIPGLRSIPRLIAVDRLTPRQDQRHTA